METRNQQNSSVRKGSKDDAKGIGGREFGNVIEPTQAEMASGNKGLAAEPKAKKKAGKKKAA